MNYVIGAVLLFFGFCWGFMTAAILAAAGSADRLAERVTNSEEAHIHG